MQVKVRRYHWYAVFLFVMGTLFPPLAVAARFGIGKDFWLNLLLTICGYIPGHAHNFYIQNVRNNKTHSRTPRWAQRYGLVNTNTIKRHERRSQWAGRFNDQNFTSTYDDQPLEDGQVQPAGPRQDSIDNPPSNDNGLWRPDDESYYSAERDDSSQTSKSGGRWRYPANFTDAVPEAEDATANKKKKKKKDRWAMTEDAYTASEQKKRKKKSKNRSRLGDGANVGSTYSNPSGSMIELEVPEEATRGNYGKGGKGNGEVVEGNGDAPNSGEQEFHHEF
ncbi:hypothetical protein BU15DRAFT_39616 [Melanogaster broomeanus]|nr:hypothetical protein BU15DRAFT_39616 [Melanogaster broomeanus]